MLQPVRRRTWAPSGQTPIQHAWDRHDRLSAIGLLNVCPSRQRLSLFFQVLRENVATAHMVWFLHQLHDYHRRKVIVIWDRSSVHRSATAYFKAQHPDWFEFEKLPSYAPELNPVEQCWNHTKHADLPNYLCNTPIGHAGVKKGGSGRNLLRFNRIHDIVGYGIPWTPSPRIPEAFQSPYFAWGIYLDDELSDTTGERVMSRLLGLLDRLSFASRSRAAIKQRHRRHAKRGRLSPA